MAVFGIMSNIIAILRLFRDKKQLLKVKKKKIDKNEGSPAASSALAINTARNAETVEDQFRKKKLNPYEQARRDLALNRRTEYYKAESHSSLEKFLAPNPIPA